MFVTICALCAAICVCGGAPAPAAAASGGHYDCVADNAGLLSQDERGELEKRAEEITENYGCAVMIVTVGDMYSFDVKFSPEDSDRDAYLFNKALYDEWKAGFGGDEGCLLLVLSMKTRDYWLEPYGSAKRAFSDYGLRVLLDDYVVPKLRRDDYYGAFGAYLDKAGEYLLMARDGRPFSAKTDPGAQKGRLASRLAVVILLPLLIAFVVCSVWKRQMKTAVEAKTADKYIPDGGFRLTGQTDAFLYRTTTQVKIPKSSSSSSSGSSHRTSGSSGRGGKF